MSAHVPFVTCLGITGRLCPEIVVMSVTSATR